MHWLRFGLACAWLGGLATPAALCQTFSSGSTGADGALECRHTTRQLQVPPSGVFNFTTVTLENCTLRFLPDPVTNPPVILLASGDVTVAYSRFNLNAGSPLDTSPGPGGFAGGAAGSPGAGPGGGAYPGGRGQWIGPLSLVPNIGGSGGGGTQTEPGWGGGGAITIASSGRIQVLNSEFNALPGAAARNMSLQNDGAPGAVRLVANAIDVQNSCFLATVARLEAPPGRLTYAPILCSSRASDPVLSDVNPVVLPSLAPSLRITSIGGYPVPAASGASGFGASLLLPKQLPDPIPVVVEARNVPPGTVVRMSISGSPSATSTAAALSGTLQASTATLQVSGLSRDAISYLYVWVSFAPGQMSGQAPPSDHSVAEIELRSDLRGHTQYRFLAADGSEVPKDQAPASLRRLLEQ